MRSDLLSKRIFVAGCFGLPWLHIVHWLYWSSNQETNDAGILNPDDHFTEEPTEATAEEIRREADKWVHRSKSMASMYVMILVAWIVVAQVLREHLPSWLYIYSADNAQLTGW